MRSACEPHAPPRFSGDALSRSRQLGREIWTQEVPNDAWHAVIKNQKRFLQDVVTCALPAALAELYKQLWECQDDVSSAVIERDFERAAAIRDQRIKLKQSVVCGSLPHRGRLLTWII